MSRHSPEEQSPEEQISAYLDGELSTDEALCVERLLADRDDLRQLHDELLAIRARLKTLYQHKLDADFSDRVLRKAEKAVLSRPTASDSTHEAAAERSDHGSNSGVWLPRPFSTARSWLWAGIAVAAAVLLVVNQPDEEGSPDDDDRLALRSGKRAESKSVGTPEFATAAFKSKNKRKQEAVDPVATPTPPLAQKPQVFDAPSRNARQGGGQAGPSFGISGAKPLRYKQPEVIQHDFLISRQALRSGAIEQLLADLQITLETKDSKGSKPGKATADLEPPSPADRPTDGPTNEPTDGARQQFEVIYIEGPPQKVEAVLSALRSLAGRPRLNALSKQPLSKQALSKQTDELSRKTAASKKAHKKAPSNSAKLAGRAWRNSREARTLSDRYDERAASKTEPRQKPEDTSKRIEEDKADDKSIAADESAAEKALPKLAATSDPPALVTVKLVLRVIDTPGDNPPAASDKSGN